MNRDMAISELQRAYKELRQDCALLERLLQRITDHAEPSPLTEKELKRLDKAVTVMKVGFKIVKKVSGASKR
jgi:hypothetical protein